MAFKNVSSGLTSIVWWAQKWKLFTWILDSAPVKSTLDYWLAWQAKHIMTTSRCWWTRPSSTTGVLCDLEHLANGFVLLTVHVHIEKSRLAPSFFFHGNRMKRNEEFEELSATRVTNLGRERLSGPNSERCCMSELEGCHSSRSQSQDQFSPHTRHTIAQLYKS